MPIGGPTFRALPRAYPHGSTPRGVPPERSTPRSILDFVGNTPVVPLRRVTAALPYRVLAKLEFLNPGGSVKDRIGTTMIDRAEAAGLLRPGGTIVEATSGNTGVGLAMVAAVRGYRAVFVLPDKMSSEKIRLLRAFGARVVVTPSGVPPDHPMSHYSVARRLAEEIPGAYYPNQYENPENPDTHYRTTGPEIDRDGGETLRAVVGTVGTGGTMSGIGRYFKEHRPDVRIVAVDPVGSILTEYARHGTVGTASPYRVEGIGEDKIPQSVHFQYLDEFVQVDDQESFRYARRLAREEGLFVGGSSGSAVAGAVRWLESRPIPEGATVVVILPDSGDRYLSKFYSDEWMREEGLLDSTATARELVARKSVPALVSVEPTTSVRDAVALFGKHGIGQVPILDGSKNLGSVHAEEVLRRLMTDDTMLDRTVSALATPPFREVPEDAPVAVVLEILSRERAILLRESPSGGIVGLLTRHDLVGYLSDAGEQHEV